MLRAAIDLQLIAKGGVHAIAARPCLQQENFFDFKAIELGGVKALNKRILTNVCYATVKSDNSRRGWFSQSRNEKLRDMAHILLIDNQG